MDPIMVSSLEDTWGCCIIAKKNAVWIIQSRDWLGIYCKDMQRLVGKQPSLQPTHCEDSQRGCGS